MDFTPEQKNSLRVVIQEVFGNVATKDDLGQFATKDDFLGIKEDLKQFATKDELEKVEERLATATANAFQQVYERLDSHDRRFEAIDQRFDRIDRRFDRLERILNHYTLELADRVDRVEKYLKLKPNHQ